MSDFDRTEMIEQVTRNLNRWTWTLRQMERRGDLAKWLMTSNYDHVETHKGIEPGIDYRAIFRARLSTLPKGDKVVTLRKAVTDQPFDVNFYAKTVGAFINDQIITAQNTLEWLRGDIC